MALLWFPSYQEGENLTKRKNSGLATGTCLSKAKQMISVNKALQFEQSDVPVVTGSILDRLERHLLLCAGISTVPHTNHSTSVSCFCKKGKCSQAAVTTKWFRREFSAVLGDWELLGDNVFGGV